MGMATEPLRSIGVILAGGRSSRMGRDKAMLSWRGQPLIEHQIDLLKAAGVDSVRVSGDRPEYQGIVDAVSHAGPVGGIASIAAVVDDAELIIIPVDMPRIQPPLLQRLQAAPSQKRCVHFAGHVLPMRLRLDATSRAALDALMAASDDSARSLRALQERVGTSEIPLHDDEAAQLIDCNTEETWREVCE
jgi:molybdenum cofactor guanylyltransferase